MGIGRAFFKGSVGEVNLVSLDGILKSEGKEVSLRFLARATERLMKRLLKGDYTLYF